MLVKKINYLKLPLTSSTMENKTLFFFSLEKTTGSKRGKLSRAEKASLVRMVISVL